MGRTFVWLLGLILLCVSSCQRRGSRDVPAISRHYASSRLQAPDTVPFLSVSTDSVVRIKVPSPQPAYDFSRHVSSFRLIPLETGGESLLGNITKLCSDSSSLFVFDRQNSLVLRFSMDGSFLGRIGRKGRGSGEYLEVMDMSLDLLRHEVCLLDLAGGKLLYYAYDGRYLRSQPLFYYYGNLEFLGGRQVHSVSFGHNGRIPSIDCHRLVVSSSSQRPLFKGFPYPSSLRERFHWGNESPLRTCGGRVFYNHLLSDTIWEVCDSLCSARYVLDFPSRGPLFPTSSLSSLSDDSYASLVARHTHFMGIYLLSEDVLCCYLSAPNNIVTPLFCNLHSGRVLYGPASWGSPDGLFSRLQAYSFNFTLPDGSFVKVLQPFDVLGLLKSSEASGFPLSLSPSERAFVSRLKEEDNPVLLVAELKPF